MVCLLYHAVSPAPSQVWQVLHDHAANLPALHPEPERVGHLVEFGAADSGAELVAVLVERGLDVRGLELREEILAVVADLVADRQEPHLFGREPRGKFAARVAGRCETKSSSIGEDRRRRESDPG